ncbi:hypothetical protein GCM10009745_79110 [Kribbella yunnanensis]|uniref:Aldehyde dehydrogenase family protein n=1 Tax=Kribbella yunnanensis TaxID=190194 RepID=A0ABN2J5I8_9ACTN
MKGLMLYGGNWVSKEPFAMVMVGSAASVRFAVVTQVETAVAVEPKRCRRRCRDRQHRQRGACGQQ